MKQIWTGSVVRAGAKYGEHAPMVAVCCNACRTCVSTNLIGLVFAGAASFAAAVVGFGRMLLKRPRGGAPMS